MKQQSIGHMIRKAEIMRDPRKAFEGPKAQGLIAWLKGLGFGNAQTRSRKYLCFAHPQLSWKVFVGKCGALRRGPNSSRSVSAWRSDITRALKRAMNRQ